VVSTSVLVLAGRARSHLDLVNWLCSLLLARLQGNTPRKNLKNKPEIVQSQSNSVMARQEHCSYKAPTTNYHIYQANENWESGRRFSKSDWWSLHLTSTKQYSARAVYPFCFREACCKALFCRCVGYVVSPGFDQSEHFTLPRYSACVTVVCV